jgi:very-short-patch-repair endonuclease
VVIGDRYIADFAAPAVRLVIEIDGGYHERRRSADARRDRGLQRLGYTVVHLTAEVVERQLEGAVEMVRGTVESQRFQR